MSTDRDENTFRERRSAYIGDEPQPSAAEETPAPAPAAPATEEREVREQPIAAPPTEDETAPEEIELDEMAALEIPEPSFHEIVYEYAIRAQQFLGDAPITRDGERRVLPTYAKHMIDLLGILEERTRGNLTPEESQLLTQILSDLRLRYVSVTS